MKSGTKIKKTHTDRKYHGQPIKQTNGSSTKSIQSLEHKSSGLKDQAQVIIFRIHYVITYLSGEDCCAGTGGKKEKRKTSSKVDGLIGNRSRVGTAC